MADNKRGVAWSYLDELLNRRVLHQRTLSGVVVDDLLASKGTKEMMGLFEKYTGTTAEKLKASGGTSCAGFVNCYGQYLGSKDALGSFDIDARLKCFLGSFLPRKPNWQAAWGKQPDGRGIGKGHAWVPRSNATRPKKGDIFLAAAHLHIGIVIDASGDTWTTLEGGQGTPELDYVSRKRRNSDGIKGWVDLDLYFDGTVQAGLVPKWLVGWWKVNWRGQTYYYRFDDRYEVKWTLRPPASPKDIPLDARDTGNFGLDINRLTIRWGATGSVERFSKVPGGIHDDGQMQGTWNDTERLSAEKL